MHVLHKKKKKLEFSISSDSTDTVNRTNKFFLITLRIGMTRWGIIPRGAVLQSRSIFDRLRLRVFFSPAPAPAPAPIKKKAFNH